MDHGIGGETITQIGARWDANIETKGYRYLVLEGGINDIKIASAGGGATAYTEYARIAGEALTAGMKCVLCTANPFEGHNQWSEVRQTELESYNASIRTLAASDPRYRLCDIYEIIREPGKRSIKGDWAQGDGLHCNLAGNAIIAEAILAKLKELIY